MAVSDFQTQASCRLRKILFRALSRGRALLEDISIRSAFVLVLTTLVSLLAVFTSVPYAECTGLCGDVDSTGNITASDFVAVSAYISSGDSAGMNMECANVDNHAGVTLRDLVFMFWNVYAGLDLDCRPDSGSFVPMDNAGYFLHYNSVFPAGDTAVMLNVDVTLGGPDVTWAVSVVARVLVDGETPLLTDAVPTAVLGGPKNWEVVAFNGPGAGNIPAGYLMGLFTSTDFGCPEPGRYPLGRAKVIMPASAQARTITLELAEFPVGANKTMAHDGIPVDLDAWVFNSAPWIIDLTGDINNDRAITASDVIGLVNYVFKGGAVPYPFAASGDVNCSGLVNSSDIIELVNFVFKGGSAPCNVAAECTITADSWTCP